jgi:hypothetical protein
VGDAEEDQVALDVYYKKDIANTLRALHVASEVPAALCVDLLQGRDLPVEAQRTALLDERETLAQDQLLAYQKGFRTALASVALAFGLVPLASAAPAASSRSVSSLSRESCEVDLRSFIESMVRSET